MKLQAYDLGVCGTEQLMYAGTVKFNDEGVNAGVVLVELPENIIVTKGVAVVKTAFNAATTNVLTVGLNDDVNDILSSSDVTEGTAGAYQKNTFVICKGSAAKVKAKFTQTGSAATAGEAEIYLGVVRIPEQG